MQELHTEILQPLPPPMLMFMPEVGDAAAALMAVVGVDMDIVIVIAISSNFPGWSDMLARKYGVVDTRRMEERCF